MEVHQGVFVDFGAFDAVSRRGDPTVEPRRFELMNADRTDYSYAPIKIDHHSLCAACDHPIVDRTLINSDGRTWHEHCFRCAGCSCALVGGSTCFHKEGTIFCRPCYARQFGAKCAACERVIQATDWVRKARASVFHLACFACDQCKRQLSTGEDFAFQDSRLLCKQHFIELVEGDSGVNLQKQKTKRVRTTFAEEQISVLQAHFQIDSNPDGADLERIANMTGLSKRVTQVWFQNSRARQKKYQGGSRKEGEGRSSEDPTSPGQKSENSSDGMIYPTSVTTSAEEAMTESTLALASLQYEL